MRLATDEWRWGGEQEWWHQGVEGTVSWPAKIESIAEQGWLQCYQLSVSAFSCSADFRNNPVSVLIVTRLHVLHSWGLLAEENHHQVKRKEQGDPPTAEYSCTSVQCVLTWMGNAVHAPTQNPIYFLVYVLWSPTRDSRHRTKGKASMWNKQYSNFNSRQGQWLEELSQEGHKFKLLRILSRIQSTYISVFILCKCWEYLDCSESNVKTFYVFFSTFFLQEFELQYHSILKILFEVYFDF